MNKPVKLPEIRKETFTKARESLGLSTKDLSGMACLSVRQIEQIENGESISFYSAQVKFTAAKKVAALLKITPEEAFDFSGIAQPVKVSEVEEKLQGETTASVVEEKTQEETEEKIANVIAKVVEPEPEPEPEPENSSAKKIKETVLDYSVKSKAHIDLKKKILLLLAIAVAVIFSVVNLRPLFFPEPVKEEVVIIQEAAPEPAPTNAPVEPVASVAAPAAVPATAVVSAECPAADPSAMNYKPDAPKKAGDMVYLQSKTAQTVCVVDATGKTQNKVLDPGVGVSIYGKPPLKVLTSGLNQVDLYYQGAKVRIGNTSSKTINLEPAEIIQPAATSTSADSQLR